MKALRKLYLPNIDSLTTLIILSLLTTSSLPFLLSSHFLQSALAFKPSGSPSEPTIPQTPSSNTTSSPLNQGSGGGNTGPSIGCGPGTDNSTCTQSSNPPQYSTPSVQSGGGGGANSSAGGFGTSVNPSGGGMSASNGFGSNPSTGGSQRFGPNTGTNNQGGFGTANGGQTGGFSSGPTNGGMSPSMGNSGDNANNGGGYGNQPGTTTANSGNFITYNIPDLRLTIQTPADWQGPTSCQSGYTGGALHIKSSKCLSTWTPNIANVQFSVRRKFSVDPSNTERLDQVSNEIRGSIKDSRVNPNLVDFIGMNKDTLNGVYPADVFRFTERDPISGSIDNALTAIIGTPDYNVWLAIHFSANPDVYDQLIPTIQKILDSINVLNGTNENNVQSLPAGSNNQQQQLGGGQGSGDESSSSSRNEEPPGNGGNNNQSHAPVVPHF